MRVSRLCFAGMGGAFFGTCMDCLGLAIGNPLVYRHYSHGCVDGGGMGGGKYKVVIDSIG